MQFFHDDIAQPLRRVGRDLHPHHLAPAAAFQGNLEFAHKVFGLVLDLEIAVAQYPERAVAHVFVAGKEAAQMQQQQFFQRQGAVTPLGRGQGDESVDLRRDRQQRLQRALVLLAFKLQRQRVTQIGDEGERMRRVDGQRRQDREYLVQEHIRQHLAVVFTNGGAVEDADILGLQLGRRVS